MKTTPFATVLCTVWLAFATAASAQSNDVGVAVSAASPAPVGETAATGTLDGTEAKAVARLYRDGIPSACSPAKAYPGQMGTGNAYRPHKLYNNGPAQCVTVNFDVGTCGVSVHLAAYAGSFNPGDLASNFLGDVGSSLTRSFSFMAPASSPVVLVAFDNYGATTRCTYSYSSDSLSATPASAVAVPILSAWAMVAMVSIMALGAVVTRRRNPN